MKTLFFFQFLRQYNLVFPGFPYELSITFLLVPIPSKCCNSDLKSSFSDLNFRSEWVVKCYNNAWILKESVI